MNPDALKSALGQIATALLALATGYGVLTNDQATSLASAISTIFTSAAAAIPAGLLIINILASIWRHYGMKKVPEKSTALLLSTQPPVGSTVDLTPMTGLAKVVG